jgi:hypothetical protein
MPGRVMMKGEGATLSWYFAGLFDLSRKPDTVVSCIPTTPARTSAPSSPT